MPRKVPYTGPTRAKSIRPNKLPKWVQKDMEKTPSPVQDHVKFAAELLESSPPSIDEQDLPTGPATPVNSSPPPTPNHDTSLWHES